MKKYWWLWVILLPTCFVFGYLVFMLWRIWPIEKYSIANAGAFGDSFGILTAWFSGMAFCAAVYLLHRQKIEFDKLRVHADKMSSIERVSFQPELIFKKSTAGIKSQRAGVHNGGYPNAIGFLHIVNNNQRLLVMNSVCVVERSTATALDKFEHPFVMYNNDVLVPLMEPITFDEFDLKVLLRFVE